MRICLTMIVKNESHVIERCLRSVLPVIDCYAIVDTGSTDDTIAVMERVLEGVPGVIAQNNEWKGFAAARNNVLALARTLPGVHYFLMMDADHVWHGEKPNSFLSHGYFVEHRYAGSHYGIACLLDAELPWYYKGVVHEYVTADVPHQLDALRGPWVEVFHDGARAQDPLTYHKDAALLRESLAKDPNPRDQFYYAQSLKDALLLQQAFEAYRERTMMQGWDEETWYARLEMARLAERLSKPPEEVQRLYLVAYNARPTRAEPLCDLARWHRLNNEWALAFMFSCMAVGMLKPADRLFVDDSCYWWRALDECIIAAWYVDERDYGYSLTKELRHRGYPADQAARIEANCKFYDREDSAVA